MDETGKNIDESWKEAAEKQKKEAQEKEAFFPEEPDFNFFASTLSIQASIALGNIPDPLTNKKEENFTQAKFLIDTLIMLQEKTKGNLNNEETQLLENMLYELRMQFVKKTQKTEEKSD